MFDDIADYVIQKLNNQVMEFMDERGRPLRILVDNMSWDKDRQQLNKRLAVVGRRVGRRATPTECLEALFFTKVTFLILQEESLDFDEANLFLEVIKPTTNQGIYVTPVF